MKGEKVLYSAASQEWGTPFDLYKSLNDEFHFTLDPCTTPDNPLGTPKFYTKAEDGLEQSWYGERVFCNPPYGKDISMWLGGSMGPHGGAPSVAVYLLPARTDTKWFHDYCWPMDEAMCEIRFIKGRLKFRGAKWPAPFPSMIVIFRG